MHRFWNSVIGALLQDMHAASIVEIGIGSGENTKHLLEFAKRNGGVIHAIDPHPSCDMTALRRTYGATLDYRNDKSLNALSDIERMDAVLIDGDHNWFTVFNELQIIEKYAKRTGSFPLVLLHDTCWPYGRRDLYYTPETIPPTYRQPFRRGGLAPSSHDVLERGGMNAHFDHGIYEHNIRNGVLTAVEDFLEQTTLSMEFVTIPCFHGLGILASTTLQHTYPHIRTLFADMTMGTALRNVVTDVEKGRIEECIRADQIAETLRGEAETLREKLSETKAEFTRRLQVFEETIERMRRSKSWRWTEWIRVLEANSRSFVDRFAYGCFGCMKDLWTDFGSPYERLVLRVRYGWLGKRWPARSTSSVETVPQVSVQSVDKTLAVIIPCHNYGRYLAEAIESVLAQTLIPADIIVVDDVSDDDTPDVAKRYVQKGVQYIRGEWRSVGEARNAGMKATRAEYVLFLDADNVLHPEYLRCGKCALDGDPQAAIAYTDQQFFGDDSWTYKTPEHFDWKRFDTHSHIDTCSLVRRTALVQAGGWSRGVESHGDWVTWRRILRLGWKAVKSRGTYFYRKHGSSMSKTHWNTMTYAQRTGFLTEDTTLCIALSGRQWAWPLTTDFLARQTFPHACIHLIVLDTSQDIEFGRMVRRWLAECDYAHHTYLAERVGTQKLAALPREAASRDVADACARIYNRFARLCTTPLCLFLEDDIVPPLDAYPRLVEQFTSETAGVSGHYFHRGEKRAVAWDTDANGHILPLQEGIGATAVGGTGFGCLALRGELLRHTVFSSGAPHGNFDQNFFRCVHDLGLKILLDQSCVCKHYNDERTWN